MDKKEIGQRIGSLLKKKGMTQRELAAMVGATECAVSKYISGDREPRAEVLANIATALGTTMDQIMGRNEGVATEYGTIYDLCARHAPNMTPEERNRLIAVIASAPLGKVGK